MVLNFNVKHNVIDLMKDYEPEKGDPLQYAKSFRPNVFAAEEKFLKVWQGKEFAFADIGLLHILIFFNHGEIPHYQPDQKLVKTKTGYSCAFHLGVESLCNNGQEKSQTEIHACIVDHVERIIERLRALLQG